MSKGSLFWANASGKLGETVLYRSGGEQRTRTYVAKIKNPKTLAQMKNRLSMRNFSQCYRAMQSVLSKSFPNRTQKESGFNAFVKANKSVKSAVISKEGALSGLCVPYNMMLAQGYLTQFGEFKRIEVNEGEFYGGFDLSGHPNVAAIRTLLGPYDTMDDFPQNLGNWQDLWDAMQLPVSAKLTLIKATYEDDGYAVAISSYDRANMPQSAFCVRMGEDANYAPILTIGGQSSESMVCAIISYVDGNGKLQVTNSRMIVPSEDESFALQFVENGDVYMQVLEQYGYNQEGVI